MALAASQLISRVLPGRPFGDGRDGAITISSNTIQSLTIRSCSGTAGSPTLAIPTSGFTNGDVVIVYQGRGTNAGAWEVEMVNSGGGSTSLTLSHNLANTYTDSGADQAFVFKLPMYTTASVSTSMAWSGDNWDGDTKGLLAFAANVGLTGAGALNILGMGYRGGSGRISTGTANQGEGTASDNSAQLTTANSNGGGGSTDPISGDGLYAGGGGGGNGTSGGAGDNNGATPGDGGTTVGSADLSTMAFGGGGGGSAVAGSGVSAGGSGGRGGGLLFAFVKNWALTGSSSVNGLSGSASTDGSGNIGSGGGGAGGSALIVCQTATLGSSLITATGGAQLSYGQDGGAGGDGRIAIHHSGAITGTTSPSATDVSDGRLVETQAGVLLNLF